MNAENLEAALAVINRIDPADLARAVHTAFANAPTSWTDRPLVEDFDLEDTVLIDSYFDLRAIALLLKVSLHDLAAQACAPLVQTPQETS